MPVEIAPFLEGKKKILVSLLTPFIAAAITAIFVALKIPPEDAANLAIKICVATGGGYVGLEFVRDMLRDRRQGQNSQEP